MKRLGALTDKKIKELIIGSFIEGADIKNVNPSSLDLSMSEEIYRLEGGIFQPRYGEKIADSLKDLEIAPHNLDYPLERDVTYFCRLNESIRLPELLYGYCNPKSSTGRNDVQVRLLADGVPRFDALTPAGFSGELWLAICPKSFPIKLSPGETLNQLRIFNEDTRFDELDLQISFEEHKLLWDEHEKRSFSYDEIKIRDNDGSLILTVDLQGDTVGLVGYECRRLNRILDFSKRRYMPSLFFETIFKKNDRPHFAKSGGYIQLRKDNFYILSTKEAVRVPPHLTCEMKPMDERSGEFRSHYAGFIDSGWGWGKEGEGCGRQLTLEVRPYEDFILRDGQPIAKIKFERVIEVPDVHYDQKDTSNYCKQKGPRLSKHFLCP